MSDYSRPAIKAGTGKPRLYIEDVADFMTSLPDLQLGYAE
jgi:hypothetical protein